MKFAANLNLKEHQFFLLTLYRVKLAANFITVCSHGSVLLSCFLLCLVSDKSCTARIMHFNFYRELDLICFTSTSVKLHQCNDASLNFNGISFFTLPDLYCVLSPDLFSVDP